MHSSRLPWLLGVVVSAGCAEWDSHTGSFCATSGVSREACARRLASARCGDGGLEARPLPDGGALLCCAWQDCRLAPFPE
jgi:hypothetical protein